MVLGHWSRKDTLYGGEGYSVTSNGDLPQQLKQAINRLPEFAPMEASPVQETAAPAFTPPPPERHITEGSFFVGDDRVIYQSQGGQGARSFMAAATLRADGTLTGKRLAALIELRDRARRVLQSQNEGWPEANRDEARRELNRAYDRFVISYGPINKTTFGETSDGNVIRRMPNLVKFREDPDAMLVMSLEDYDEVTGKAAKAAIMTKDVVGKTPPVTQVQSAEEGLLVSLNQRGAVDLPFIAALYGKPAATGHRRTGRSHLPRPGIEDLADRRRLSLRRRAGEAQNRRARRIGLRPQRRSLEPRAARGRAARRHRRRLRRPWIPESDIQAFAAELFRVDPASVPVAHLKKDAVWSLDAGYAAKASVAATSEYGTARANGCWLLELALNMKSPTIYDTFRDGDREEKRGEPGGDARRPRKTKAHQGTLPLVDFHRSGTHRAARAALQRHLQQSASPPVRRLAPRLPRHEPDHPACGRTRTTRSGAA